MIELDGSCTLTPTDAAGATADWCTPYTIALIGDDVVLPKEAKGSWMDPDYEE